MFVSRFAIVTEDLLICCYQVTKNTAQGTAPPMRLLRGALVMLILWQISQYRSLGKRVYKHCVYPNPRQVSLHLSGWSLQGIAAGIGNSDFLRAFFVMRLNSSPSGPTKKIPRNFLALSSFGFFDWPLLLFFAFRRIRHSKSLASVSGLEVVCFLSVSSQTIYINPVVFQ